MSGDAAFGWPRHGRAFPIRPRGRAHDSGPVTVRLHDVDTGERLWSATMEFPVRMHLPAFPRPVVTTVIYAGGRYDTWPDGTLIP